MSSPNSHPTSLGFRVLGLVLLSAGIAGIVFKFGKWNLQVFGGNEESYFLKTDLRPVVLHLWAALLLFLLLFRHQNRFYIQTSNALKFVVRSVKASFLPPEGMPPPSCNDKSETNELQGESFPLRSSRVERILLCFGVFSLIWLAVNYLGGGLKHYSIGVAAMLPFCAYWVMGLPGFGLVGDSESTKRDKDFVQYAILSGLSVILILIYFHVNRPDLDDRTYLRIGLFALEQPGETLSSNRMRIDYRFSPGERLISSYDLFRAIPSYVFGLPWLISYYAVLPPLLLSTVPFLISVFFRRLFGLQKHWLILAVAITLILLVVWADSHRTPANFGIVRAFQGKSIYATLIVPLQILCFLRLVRQPGVRHSIEALFAAAAGVFFTMNALIIGAWLMVVLVLCTSALHRKWGTLACSLPVVLYFTLIAVIAFGSLKSHFKPDLLRAPFSSHVSSQTRNPSVATQGYASYSTSLSATPLGASMLGVLPSPTSIHKILASSFHRDRSALATRSNLEILQFAYGNGLRSCIILCSLFLVFWTGIDPGIKRLLLVMTVLFILPYSLGPLAAASNSALAWRIFWALPVAWIVPGALVCVAAKLGQHKCLLITWVVVVSWVLMVFSIPGKSIFHHNNGMQGTTIGFSPIKLRSSLIPRAAGSKDLEVDGIWILYQGKRF